MFDGTNQAKLIGLKMMMFLNLMCVYVFQVIYVDVKLGRITDDFAIQIVVWGTSRTLNVQVGSNC